MTARRSSLFVVLCALVFQGFHPAPTEADSTLSLAGAWKAWSAGEISVAREASSNLVATRPDDASARHLAMLTTFVSGEYATSVDHYARLEKGSELRGELLSLALDALEHAGRLQEAADLAGSDGASAERTAWLERRAHRPLTVELAASSVIAFSPDNFLSELMPAVPLEIDGLQLLGHLDTGGSYIAMSPRMAESLGIAVQPLSTGFANNRETTVSAGLANQVLLGQATLRNVPVIALDALTGVAQGQDIEDMVILGTNILNQFLTTWDNGKRQLILSPRNDPEAARAHYATWVPSDAVAVPYYLYSDHYMFARGQLGEHPAVFFLDTGLVTVDSQGRQPGIGAARSVLTGLRLTSADATEASLDSPPISLGELRQEDHSIYVLGERVAFDWHGLAVTGLLTHGFTKQYSWTLDAEKRLWFFAEIAVDPVTEQAVAEGAQSAVAQDLSQLVGQYAVAPGVALAISADSGTLYLQAPGQQKVPLEAVREDAFAIPLAKAEVFFFRDETGVVTHFVLDQNGFETRATRLTAESTSQ